MPRFVLACTAAGAAAAPAFTGRFDGLAAHYNPTATGLSPSADDYWAAVNAMYQGGPRLTGSPAHTAFLDEVSAELSAAGFAVQRDALPFTRWDVSNGTYSLVITDADGVRLDIPVAYPYVRSGLTPPGGLTFPLRSGALLPDRSGHIHVTSGTMTVLGPTGCASESEATVCCISNTPHVQLKGDYQPFTPGIPQKQIPTLMVGSDQCARVQAAAAAGLSATLTLTGTQAPGETSHVWGVLQGRSDDTVMLGVHSDGQNAVEENGIPSLLLMAKYFASLPLSSPYRARSLGFAAVAGHMDYDVPHHETQGFAALHSGSAGGGDNLMARVVVAVAPEHFGTMQWHFDKASGEYVATGKPCEYTAYGSNLALEGLVKGALNGANASSFVAITGPLPLEAGSALGWREHGVPTIGGISLPDYLVNLDHGGPDKLDKRRFFSFASGYMDAIGQLLSGHRI